MGSAKTLVRASFGVGSVVGGVVGSGSEVGVEVGDEVGGIVVVEVVDARLVVGAEELVVVVDGTTVEVVGIVGDEVDVEGSGGSVVTRTVVSGAVVVLVVVVVVDVVVFGHVVVVS